MATLDVQRLLDRAQALDGRPLPGVRMTEAQFDAWCGEDVRAEWVDGEVIVMSPANSRHNRLNLWLLGLLQAFVEHHDAGEIFGIEMQLRLSSRRSSRRNPDAVFVARARANLVEETYIDGAPDLVMEIVSPDSESRDWRDKYIEYEAAGVREYWVIDPASQRLEAYTLTRARKYRRLDESQGRLPSKVLRGFYLRPEWLWQSPLPKLATVLKELGVR
ncbi:MAG TPA: Uma2 family endonuclease [Tepidisphaeraceae bacterium]|nr:Uma2 family endonuclease [Tepidisphaeraceae bacterium]